MTKLFKHSALILVLTMSLAAVAQDAKTESPAPADGAKKTCAMGGCMAMMKQAPKKGFHATIEWGGVYGGPRNDISYRMFGRTFNMNMTFREAVRVGAGYQLNDRLYLGGGAAAEFQYKAFTNKNFGLEPNTTNYTGSLWVVPIFAEIKGYLLKKPISPFLQWRVGYAPAIYVAEGQPIVEHSYYDNFSVGVRIYNHMSITAGYLFRYQPQSVTGFDKSGDLGASRTVMTDKSSPMEHRFTLGIVIHIK
jgi:hypothetical protein